MVRKEMLKIPVACSLPLQKVFVSGSTPSLGHFSWSIPLTSHCQRPNFKSFPAPFCFSFKYSWYPSNPPSVHLLLNSSFMLLRMASLHQPVSLGPFIDVTWRNNALDIFLFFPQNQIFPQKQSFQDTQKICHGFHCTSVPLPSLAIPTCNHVSPESLITWQVSKNGPNSCFLVFILLFNPLSWLASNLWLASNEWNVARGMWFPWSNKLARVSLPWCLWKTSCHASYNHGGMISANNLQELRNRASVEKPVPGKPWLLPCERIQLSYAWTPDPEKLQDKCVLC